MMRLVFLEEGQVSPTCEKAAAWKTGRGLSPESNHVGTLIPGFQPLEL